MICHILLGRVGKSCMFFFFFFNDTATTEIYTLSLHDALPICDRTVELAVGVITPADHRAHSAIRRHRRSEEHTSELQSHVNLVCRLLLEKKKNLRKKYTNKKETPKY